MITYTTYINWLTQAYKYYFLDDADWSDGEWEYWARQFYANRGELLKESFPIIHRDEFTGASLFWLRKDEYPKEVVDIINKQRRKHIMSRNAQRFANRKENKVAGTSQHQPKPKWEEDRQERSQSKRIQPKTNKQKLYQHMLESLTLVVADGPAGVGKSLLPCNHAATLLLAKKIEQIVLVRPYAATGSKTMGFNKGNLTDKIFPFMLPMIGYIKDVLGAATVDIMLEDGRILIQPLETIRGQSFKNAYVIADEMQSAEVAEIQALTTRIGEDCTLVICGDKRQNDVKKGLDGISYIKKILDNYPIRDSGVIEFSVDDVCRSGICKDFILAYENEGWV